MSFIVAVVAWIFSKFLLSSERCNSIFATEQLPTEPNSPAHEKWGEEEGRRAKIGKRGMIITICRVLFSDREGMSKKEQKRNWKKGSNAKIDHAFHMFVFGVTCFYCLEFEDGDGGRVWVGKKTGSGGGKRRRWIGSRVLFHTLV